MSEIVHSEAQALELFPADASGRHGLIAAVFQRAGWWPADADTNQILAWSAAAPAANLYWRSAAPQSGEFVEYDRRLAYFAALADTRFAPGAKFRIVAGRQQAADALFYRTQFVATPAAPAFVAAWIRRAAAADRRALIAAELYQLLRSRGWLVPVSGDDGETYFAAAAAWKFSEIVKSISERITCCSVCASLAKKEIAALTGVLRQKREVDVALEHRRAARCRPDVACSIMALNAVAMIEEYERLGGASAAPAGVITDAWYFPAAAAERATESERAADEPGSFRIKARFALDNESFIAYNNREMLRAARIGASAHCGGIVR